MNDHNKHSDRWKRKMCCMAKLDISDDEDVSISFTPCECKTISKLELKSK